MLRHRGLDEHPRVARATAAARRDERIARPPRCGVTLAIVLCATGCTSATEQPVWSCPPEPGEDASWPRSVSALYAERGSASPGVRVEAWLEGELLGIGTARDDGSYLVPLRTRERDTLEDARVELELVDETTGRRTRAFARIARAAPVTLYLYRDSCDGAVWTLDVDLHTEGDGAVPIERGLGVDFTEAGRRDNQLRASAPPCSLAVQAFLHGALQDRRGCTKACKTRKSALSRQGQRRSGLARVQPSTGPGSVRPPRRNRSLTAANASATAGSVSPIASAIFFTLSPAR